MDAAVCDERLTMAHNRTLPVYGRRKRPSIAPRAACICVRRRNGLLAVFVFGYYRAKERWSSSGCFAAPSRAVMRLVLRKQKCGEKRRGCARPSAPKGISAGRFGRAPTQPRRHNTLTRTIYDRSASGSWSSSQFAPTTGAAPSGHSHNTPKTRPWGCELFFFCASPVRAPFVPLFPRDVEPCSSVGRRACRGFRAERSEGSNWQCETNRDSSGGTDRRAHSPGRLRCCPNAHYKRHQSRLPVRPKVGQ